MAALFCLAEQDSVEPKASKVRYWTGEGEACTGTIHILPSFCVRFYAMRNRLSIFSTEKPLNRIYSRIVAYDRIKSRIIADNCI
jgi:hypothetical protein